MLKLVAVLIPNPQFLTTVNMCFSYNFLLSGCLKCIYTAKSTYPHQWSHALSHAAGIIASLFCLLGGK